MDYVYLVGRQAEPFGLAINCSRHDHVESEPDQHQQKAEHNAPQKNAGK
jgi:hypothetical protein